MNTFSMGYIKNGILKGFKPYVWDFFDYMAGVQERSERTIKAYAMDIRYFYDFLITASPNIRSYEDITIEYLRCLTIKDIQEYLSYLRSGVDLYGNEIHEDASTRSRRLSALRSFFQYLVKDGSLEVNIAKLVDTPKIPGKMKPRLSDDEVAEMLDNIAEGNTENAKQKPYLERSRLRDYAIITLLSLTGIRVSELVNLDIGDVDFRNLQMKVIRKGGKQEIVLINEEVADALVDYIDNERFSKDDTEPALFLSSRTKNNARLSVSAVERLVKKFGKTVTAESVTPHTMRRTFGSKVYAETGDIYLVADVLGHSDVKTTTAHYAGMSSERKALVRATSYHKKKEP